MQGDASINRGWPIICGRVFSIGVDMKHLRFFALAFALIAAFSARALVGQSGTSLTSGSAPAGPFDSLHFRQLGPAGMSGRIADPAVYEANPPTFYVGSAPRRGRKTTTGGPTLR